jgi:hypothetical protein
MISLAFTSFPPCVQLEVKTLMKKRKEKNQKQVLSKRKVMQSLAPSSLQQQILYFSVFQ